MNLQIGADDVLLNLDRNQLAFEKTVQQLSSGLRINSAADDPSGNAIATNLTSKVNGLQQAVNNVQNGINALNVANGALGSVQNILVRINNLIVEANSDINSTQDLQDIQTEIESLLTEINTIGEKTNFNGLNLLDGAFDTSTGSLPTFTEVASPYGSGSTQVENETGAGGSGPLIAIAPGLSPIPLAVGTFVPALMVYTVTGYSAGQATLEIDAYSTASDFGPAPLYSQSIQIPTGSGQTPNEELTTADGTGLLMENFQIANLSPNDVGVTMAFLSTDGAPAGTGTALSLNDGGDEGDTLSISLPTINTGALGLADVSVLAPTVEDANFNVSTSSSNNFSASYSQLLVQNALTTITTNEAQIGAQIVAMNDDDTDDNTAIVNYQQSVSQLADLNVGQATTQYTQEQILTSVGTEVLSQIESNAKIMTALLIQALIA
ncbi:MAG TPA: flagellin [Candidatus Baltobacteraceae bacterium]|nr:flagellin [Candidatus Baltobacteraceae bacterium]